LALWAAVAAISCCAALLYLRFYQTPRTLWCDVAHDRNAHLYSGLSLATDLRLGDIGHLFSDLDSFRTWPPLHDGVFVGFFVLLSGGDERWAVLPSLLAWAGCVVFGFLLAPRCAPKGGVGAGLIAALFVLVSPAQRAYATDVMLESCGAGFTMASLYFYIAARQDRTAAAYRSFAIALTALFFIKYNYWFLVAVGIGADQLAANSTGLLNWLRGWLSSWDRPAWIAIQIRKPGNYIVLAVLVFSAALTLRGGLILDLFGSRIPVRPSPNLVTIVYVVLVLRLLPWFLRSGRRQVSAAAPEVRSIVYWHLYPILIWFLWPYRLFSFLWVLIPASNSGENPNHNPVGGYGFYANAISGDYHIAPWSAVLAVCLFLAAFWVCLRGKLRPGAAVLFWFVGIACVLTFHHPNRKSRFLHSWIPLVWVGAGVGAAALVPDRLWQKRSGSWLFIVMTAAVAAPHLPGLIARPRAPEGGIDPARSCALDITDAYLPDLATSSRAAVFSNMPIKYLAQWTYMQRYHRQQRLETEVRGFDFLPADNTPILRRWLTETACDTVVYVDIPQSSAFYYLLPGTQNLGQYGSVMETQTRFSLIARHALPRYGCTVSVWRRLGTPVR